MPFGYCALRGLRGLPSLVPVGDVRHDIRPADPLFGSLRVWQDADSHSISQAGELKSLDEQDIEPSTSRRRDVSYEFA